MRIVMLVLTAALTSVCMAQSSMKEAFAPKGEQAEFSNMENRGGDIDSLEEVFERWVASQPKEAAPYYRLSQVYIDRGLNPARAKELIYRGLNQELTNNEGARASFAVLNPYVPLLYGNLAALYIRDNDYVSALAAIQAAKEFSRRDISYSTLVREGQIWQLLNRNEQAERSYLQGYLRGSKEAEDSLRAMFIAENESIGGFDVYLSRLAEETLDKAPDITGTNLKGERFNLRDYRGKVVVLNFWKRYCPGCMMEEESLYWLTRAVDTSKVALIALGREDEAKVRQYLNPGEPGRERDFYHMQVPGALDAIDAYNVTAFPTHVIIDKAGRITAVREGGSPEMDKALMPLIKAAGSY